MGTGLSAKLWAVPMDQYGLEPPRSNVHRGKHQSLEHSQGGGNALVCLVLGPSLLEPTLLRPSLMWTSLMWPNLAGPRGVFQGTDK